MWPGGTCTGIGTGGVLLLDTMRTVAGPESWRIVDYNEENNLEVNKTQRKGSKFYILLIAKCDQICKFCDYKINRVVVIAFVTICFYMHLQDFWVGNTDCN